MICGIWNNWIKRINDPKNRVDVVLFKFSATLEGWRVETRVLKEHLVYFVVKNEAEAMVDGASLRMKPGDLLWVDPGIEQSFWNADPKRPVELFHFRFRLLDKRRDVLGGRRAWLVGQCPAVRLTLAEMLAEYRSGQVFAGERFRALLSSLFVLMARYGTTADRQPNLTSGQCAAIERFAMARDHCVTPAELANQARLSADYFRRLFVRTYGLAPKTWLVRQRIASAGSALLESNLTIGEVAEHMGYPDVFQFSRQFKQVMGVSPRAYREEHAWAHSLNE